MNKMRRSLLLLLPGLLYGTKQSAAEATQQPRTPESSVESLEQPITPEFAIENKQHLTTPDFERDVNYFIDKRLGQIFSDAASEKASEKDYVAASLRHSIHSVVENKPEEAKVAQSRSLTFSRGVPLASPVGQAASSMFTPEIRASLEQRISDIALKAVAQIVSTKAQATGNPKAVSVTSDVMNLIHKEIQNHVTAGQATLDFVNFVGNDQDAIANLMSIFNQQKQPAPASKRSGCFCCHRTQQSREIPVRSIGTAVQSVEAFFSSPQMQRIEKLVFNVVLDLMEATPLAGEIAIGIDIAEFIKQVVSEHLTNQQTVLTIVDNGLQNGKMRQFFAECLLEVKQREKRCKAGLLACCFTKKSEPQLPIHKVAIANVMRDSILQSSDEPVRFQATSRGLADIFSSVVGAITSVNAGAVAIGITQSAGSSTDFSGTLSDEVAQFVAQSAKQAAQKAITQSTAGSQGAVVADQAAEVISQAVTGQLNSPEIAAEIVGFLLKDGRAVVALGKVLFDAQKRQRCEQRCWTGFKKGLGCGPSAQAHPIVGNQAHEHVPASKPTVKPAASAQKPAARQLILESSEV